MATVGMWEDLTFPRTVMARAPAPPATLSSAGPREVRPTEKLPLPPNWISGLGLRRKDTAGRS